MVALSVFAAACATRGVDAEVRAAALILRSVREPVGPAIPDDFVPRTSMASAPVASAPVASASVASASPRPARVDRCGGARRPSGYRLSDGYPSRGRGRNPQDAALYLQSVLSSARTSKGQKACLASGAADAILRTAVRRDGALLFPYSFAYSLGRAGRLRAPWFSGLAQTTLMGSFLSIARLTGDPAYERAARETFASLFAAGGPVSAVADGAWVQEYPSATPSYVLNGHLFSIMSARSFGEATGDARGRDLFMRGADAAETLLPLFDVPLPGGSVSAYDLVRRDAGAPIRIVGARVEEALIVDAAGRSAGTLDAEAVATGVRPRYPVSVLASPRVFLRVAYRGAGAIDALADGRWVRIAALESGAAPAVIEIPQRFQGRTINMRYHAMHVDLLRRLAHATGNQVFAHWADRWATNV